MTAIVSTATDVCRVLHEDRELADAVAEAHRSQAIRDCVARVIPLRPGRWTAQSATLSGGLGLLVLDGLLVRRVGIDERYGAELLGQGDLLRPWQENPTLTLDAVWRILKPTRLAILDEEFANRVAPHPQLTSCLVGRALQRSRNLVVNLAIIHQSRVDVRLHMLFWYLAGRWGRVGAKGLVLPVRLTHTVLADLVAARRPTVTSALCLLARQELIESVGGGWLLKGEPPGELLQLSPVSIQAP